MNTTLDDPESDCSSTCSGNANELCGAGYRLSVYNNPQFNPPLSVPVHVPCAGGYNWVDCYANNAARVLLGASYGSNNMTVENCAAFCNVQSWQMMGIEYASQCFCSNVTNSAGSHAPTTDCNMLCSGNSVSSSLALSILPQWNCSSANGQPTQIEYCGAGWRLDFYAKPDAVFHLTSQQHRASLSRPRRSSPVRFMRFYHSESIVPTTASKGLVQSVKTPHDWPLISYSC